MKYTKKFLKYTTLGLLAIVMLASFIVGAVCAIAGIFGPIIDGSIQYLLLIPVALFGAFMGFIALDCACAFVDRYLD